MTNDAMSRGRAAALRGVLIALAMILSYIESFIPIGIAIPGVKLGLANIVTIYALERLGTRDALVISLLRVFLSAMLFGNPAMMVYGLAGAVFSILMMSLVKKLPFFGRIGISVTGAVSHNLAQCTAAALLLRNAKVFHYLPVLLISGIIAGIVIGTISAVILKSVDVS